MTNEEMAVRLEKEAAHNTHLAYATEDDLRAGAAALRTGEWKPIADAPKDGGKTRLLVKGRYAHPFDPRDEREACTEAYHNRLLDQWIDRQGHYFLPTHYRELPAPPEGA